MSWVIEPWAGQFARGIIRFSECPSTNSWAIANSALIESDKLPLLITADRQISGRGRSGRHWYADEGTLTFSLLSDVDDLHLDREHLSRISLIVGLSVAEAIDDWIPPNRASLKWPNDIYLAGRKAAGILVESTPLDRLVIGVGVNVTTNLAAADPIVRQSAISLHEVAGRHLERYDMLYRILERFDENLQELASADWVTDPWMDLVKSIRARCYLTGHSISLLQGQQQLEGLCEGVDETGALRVSVNGRMTLVQSGEVVRIK